MTGVTIALSDLDLRFLKGFLGPNDRLLVGKRYGANLASSTIPIPGLSGGER